VTNNQNIEENNTRARPCTYLAQAGSTHLGETDSLAQASSFRLGESSSSG